MLARSLGVYSIIPSQISGARLRSSSIPTRSLLLLRHQCSNADVQRLPHTGVVARAHAVPTEAHARPVPAAGWRKSTFSTKPISQAQQPHPAQTQHINRYRRNRKSEVVGDGGTAPAPAATPPQAAVAPTQTVTPADAEAATAPTEPPPAVQAGGGNVGRKRPARPTTSRLHQGPQQLAGAQLRTQQQQQQQQQWQPQAGPVPGNVAVRGTVSVITYQKDDFLIAKLKDVEGTTDPSAPADTLKAGGAVLAAAAKPGLTPLCVKGVMPGVVKGDTIEVQGSWEGAPPTWLASQAPTEPEALLVRCIPGVGQATAARIIAELQGEDVRKVLSSDDAVQRLAGIKGIGKKKAEKFKQDWDANTGSHEAAAWLRQHKVPSNIVARLLREFGAGAHEIAIGNPYGLVDTGIGFRLCHAEELAASIGFNQGAPERAAAVLHHELKAAVSCSSAHCMQWHQLQQKALHKLSELGHHYGRPWPQGLSLRDGAQLLVQDGTVVVEEYRSDLLGQQASTSPSAAAGGAGWKSQQGGQQQQQQQFVRVHTDWSDTALFMLSDLYTAEQDVIHFYVQQSKACHKVIARLQQEYGNGSSTNRDTSQAAVTPSSTAATPLPFPLVPISPEASELIAQCEEELSAELGTKVVLNEGQQHALMLAAVENLPAMVLTGGPGCGKTLISQAIARTWLDGDLEISMAAPTGRAAQRLQEMVTGGNYNATASTIHRLLGYQPHQMLPAADAVNATLGKLCKYGKQAKLESVKLLIDEVSMMDIPLAAALYNAINCRHSDLLLVGDPDQLPPVGPGRPLAAVMEAGLLPCIDLRQIYRSAAGSAIINAAHAINNGTFPNLTTWDISPVHPAQDLAAHLAALPVDPATGRLQLPSTALFLRLPDGVAPETVADTLVETVRQLLPRLQYDPRLDVQVLSPRKQHVCGAEALNARLQNLLNPRGAPAGDKPPPHSRSHAHQAPAQHTNSRSPGPVRLPPRMSMLGRGRAHQAPVQPASSRSSRSHDLVWHVGDRVIHLENDPQRDVYNGDLGYIDAVDPFGDGLTVRYSPRGSSAESGSLFHIVEYTNQQVHEQLKLAWAVTVHKAQGGEFPVVLMPLEKTAGRLLLSRSMLYTAVSRAKQLLLLVGTDEAIAQCLHNTEGRSSNTHVVTDSWTEMEEHRLTMKLRAAAAANGLKPFPRLVYGADGCWHTN